MPRTDAQKRAQAAFKRKTYANILLMIRPMSLKDDICQAANNKGMSINAYCIQAIVNQMDRDKSNL